MVDIFHLLSFVWFSSCFNKTELPLFVPYDDDDGDDGGGWKEEQEFSWYMSCMPWEEKLISTGTYSLPKEIDKRS